MKTTQKNTKKHKIAKKKSAHFRVFLIFLDFFNLTKPLTDTFMMIFNGKNALISMLYNKIFLRVKG